MRIFTAEVPCSPLTLAGRGLRRACTGRSRKFSSTPYGWLTGINGNVTARGHNVDVDESFIEIAEKSDSSAVLMGYFEARKGRLGFFTDAVWADLGFPGHVNYDINRSVSGNPFARLPDFKGTIKGNLNINARAQLDYQSTIIQSGVAFEIAKWGNGGGPGFTALDILGSARYWSQDVDLSLRIDGKLTADIEADFQRLGLKVQRKVKGSRFVAVYVGDLEGSIRWWVCGSGTNSHRGRSSICWRRRGSDRGEFPQESTRMAST